MTAVKKLSDLESFLPRENLSVCYLKAHSPISSRAQQLRLAKMRRGRQYDVCVDVDPDALAATETLEALKEYKRCLLFVFGLPAVVCPAWRQVLEKGEWDLMIIRST